MTHTSPRVGLSARNEPWPPTSGREREISEGPNQQGGTRTRAILITFALWIVQFFSYICKRKILNISALFSWHLSSEGKMMWRVRSKTSKSFFSLLKCDMICLYWAVSKELAIQKKMEWNEWADKSSLVKFLSKKTKQKTIAPSHDDTGERRTQMSTTCFNGGMFIQEKLYVLQ